MLRIREAGIRNLVGFGEIRRVGVVTSCIVAAASWKIVAIFTPWLELAVVRERLGVPRRFLPLFGVALRGEKLVVGGPRIPVPGRLPAFSTEGTTHAVSA